MAEEEVKPEEKPEVWGPTKPPRLSLFGRRYERPRGVRYRTDGSPIGFRVPKSSRRLLRGKYAKRYTIANRLFHPKFITVELKLENEQKFRALARENTENSHEAKRLYEKDLACRSEQRKKNAREDWVKRTGAGEVIRPIGMMPTRAQRRKVEREMKRALKKQMKDQALADRMGAVVAAPPIPNNSPSTTDE